MESHCGTVTEEGNEVCIPGACSCSSDAQHNEPVYSIAPPAIKKNIFSITQFFLTLKETISFDPQEKKHVEKNS